MEKRPALGKGLSALIPDAAEPLAAPRASLEVDIDQLEPNHYQPRGPIDVPLGIRNLFVSRSSLSHAPDKSTAFVP